MSAEQRQAMIDDYAREEVLYREAKAFGLEQGDYIIRRRLVQKLEFISEGLAEAATTITEEQLSTYYDANATRYRIAPTVTFTHVFFDAERRGYAEAETAAARKLMELNGQGVPFAQAPQHGDRFPYHVNYVERTPDFVASHFGGDIAQAVFELSPDKRRWAGPFRSPYGAHLVLVAGWIEGRTPPLPEIKGRVLQDLERELIRERKDKVVAEIVKTYEIEIAPALLEAPEKVAGQ
jgi:parvulin-like peptidyl-prolyl isomerase